MAAYWAYVQASNRLEKRFMSCSPVAALIDVILRSGAEPGSDAHAVMEAAARWGGAAGAGRVGGRLTAGIPCINLGTAHRGQSLRPGRAG